MLRADAATSRPVTGDESFRADRDCFSLVSFVPVPSSLQFTGGQHHHAAAAASARGAGVVAAAGALTAAAAPAPSPPAGTVSDPPLLLESAPLAAAVTLSPAAAAQQQQQLALPAAPGRGRVSLTATFDDSEQLLRIRVADTGRGLSQEGLARLFKPFAQAEGPETKRRFGGTGLGLCISRDIARALGGA